MYLELYFTNTMCHDVPKFTLKIFFRFFRVFLTTASFFFFLLHCLFLSSALLLGSNSINRVTANMENGENEGTAKIIAPSPIKRSVS